MENKKIWESSDIVKKYSRQNNLKKPEKAVLKLFRNKLKNMKMLDIGIGGGRTTYHFARLTKEYIGIDYSKNMIKACEKRFPNRSRNITFRVCDVRSMEEFENNYFDFILFSFNGLDYILHEDRIKALKEIKRVGKTGAFFFFSTHNLQSINKLFTIQFSINPIKLYLNICLYILRLLLNKNLKNFEKSKYAVIRDGDQIFKLKSYYITPAEQIKQLKELGFTNISLYSIETGDEITDISKLNTIKDAWIYYLTNI